MKKITIEFTVGEAKALVMAAGNSVEYEDIMDSIFAGATASRAAGYRAYNKLQRAAYGHPPAEVKP